MKISIITPCYNSEETIRDTLESVRKQTYPNVEYIIVDGASTDGTLDIIKKYYNQGCIDKFISESDKGVYDAMNKGIKLAQGDIIGILNADDFYAHKQVLGKVASTLRKTQSDCCWGNLVYVNPQKTDKIIRYWKSSPYDPKKLKWGWLPPHPTFFVRKRVYEKYGSFNLNFNIAADCELMLRFLRKYKIKSAYIDDVLVKMRTGGLSNKNLKNIIKCNWDYYRAWKANGLRANPLMLLTKPLSKLWQLRL